MPRPLAGEDEVVFQDQCGYDSFMDEEGFWLLVSGY